MTHIFSFCVEGPPVPYQRAQPLWDERRSVTPEQSRTYRRLVATVASLHLPPGWQLKGRFRMGFRFYTLHERGDVDNYVKNIKDALQKVAYKNDNMVCGYDETERIVDMQRPRAEITVRRVVE